MHPCTTDSNHPESSIGMEAQLVLASFLLCYLFLGQVRALLTFSTSLSIQLFEAADERNPTEHDRRRHALLGLLTTIAPLPSPLHPVHANYRLPLPISYPSLPIRVPHTLSPSSLSRRSSGAASPSSSQRPPSRTGTRQRTSRAASR